MSKKLGRAALAIFGASLLVAICPALADAQTTGGGTGGTGGLSGGGGGGGGGGTSSGGLSSGGLSGNSSTGFVSTGSTLASSSQTNKTSTSGSSTTIPTSANPFAASYGNPFSLGMPANYYPNGSGGFGAPNTTPPTFGVATMYTTTSSTTTGGTTTPATTAAGFNTIGIPRNPSYSTVLSSDFPRHTVAPKQLVSNLQGLLNRCSALKDKKNLEVVTASNGVVILRGQVGDERERRLAAGLIMSEPGVREVQNQLVVVNTQK